MSVEVGIIKQSNVVQVFQMTTSTNVLWIRNCSTYSELVTLRVRWASGQPADAAEYAAASGGLTLWRPSWKYDNVSEIRLRQWMRIYAKNNAAKFHLDPIWGFLLVHSRQPFRYFTWEF